MNSKENKGITKTSSLMKITIIMMVACIIFSFIKIISEHTNNKKIESLKREYDIAKQEADKLLEEDEKKWDILNGNYIINPGEEDKNKETLQEIMKNINEEFLEAVNWAQQKNSESLENNITPFDKEGFKDNYYYGNANKIKSEIDSKEKRIEKTRISREFLYLAIITFICELWILKNGKKLENKILGVHKNKIFLIIGILIFVSAVII